MSFKNIDESQFKEALNNNEAQIIDVRTPLEVASGFIPSALALDISNPSVFASGIMDLDTEVPVYVYCRSGARSASACAMMAQMGFEELYNLKGGILSWTGPIVR